MKVKFLCAYNSSSGKFFSHEDDGRITTPIHVDHPYYADKIVPFSFQNADEFFRDIKPTHYYFENSSRMKEWLSGFEMVLVEMELDYRIIR